MSASERHLWMHFTDMSRYAQEPPTTIVRGEGAYVWDSNGKRYLDGLSGLFVVQAGHGRQTLAEAAARQAQELAYFPLWSFAHPSAIELADVLVDRAPDGIEKVFFCSGGSEAVETAWKLAKQYFRLIGKPSKRKVISRQASYHGTTQGALAITGMPAYKIDYEPLVPGSVRVPNTNFYHAPEYLAGDEKAFGRWTADRIEEAIVAEGPDTVAAVFLEPVQNAGGSIPPPPGYFDRVREICDLYDVLLVSDEVICAYGRLGTMFGSQKCGYRPDIITTAKGLTSGYSPLGATLVSDRVFEPFRTAGNVFTHGYTFGGHPVSCAVGLANLRIIDEEDLLGNVLRHENWFRGELESLLDIAIVGDVRGDGYFYCLEIVEDQASKSALSPADADRVLGFVDAALFDRGLHCRVTKRGVTTIQLAPPLICGERELGEAVAILRDVLVEAARMV